MDKEIIEIFEVNTNAVATNRGFYYQYLVLLKKWIKNYIDNKDIAMATEVDDDIKEIGEELIFTQVKCYTSSFSLHSKEVKKTLFNFFILYLKNKDLKEKISFCFNTNSKVAVKEKLLSKWIQDSSLKDKELLALCTKKIVDVLNKETKVRKNKILQKTSSSIQKEEIKLAHKKFIEEISANNIELFVKKLNWQFGNESPENAIDSITKEIYLLLESSKFRNSSKHLLFSALLSEIYRASQKEKKSDRVLTNDFISKIVRQTNNELAKLVDKRLVRLLNIEIESLKFSIEEIRKIQEAHSKEIKFLKGERQISKNTNVKNLNLLPDFYSTEVFGWDDFLDEVKTILFNNKVLSVSAPGGMGKSTLGKKFLSTYYNEYKHVVWLNVENSIQSSFLLDIVLQENLKVVNTESKQSDEQVFKIILNKLNRIEGANLLILDIQDSINEIQTLKLSYNWQKLVLTRSNLKNTPSIKLPYVSFNELKRIYLNNCVKEPGDDLLNRFFGLVDYNILVIELVAKTINNSFDLTLKSFLKSYTEQNLNEVKFNINIDISDKEEPVRIFTYLIERFSLPTLENSELNYLEFLVLLPSNNIIIEDLILINGKSHYEENKITIMNIVNSLDRKGLLVISEDRKRIDIHKVVREVLIYNQREKLSSFTSSMFPINWLIRRIEEGYNEPRNSFRYLRYAESILNSIKEEFRRNVYQPLLLLENEFLYAKRFYTGAKSNLVQLINLSNRASNYPSLNKNSLGVIYNNLALCYAENNKNDLAIIYFNKALESYIENDKKVIGIRILTLNNLSNVHLLDKDLLNVVENFKKVQKIRKKYNLYDDQQLSIEYRILSKSYAIAGDFRKAIKLLMAGIDLHESLDKNLRNDFYLASYHNELSNLFLMVEDIAKAVEHQEMGIKILEGMGLNNSSYLLTMYEISMNLYEYLGLEKKETKIKEKINLFKIYQS